MTTAWKWAVPIMLAALITAAANWPMSRVEVLEHRAKALEDTDAQTAARLAAIEELRVTAARMESKLDSLADEVRRAVTKLEESPKRKGK